jgi:hypothetical protein
MAHGGRAQDRNDSARRVTSADRREAHAADGLFDFCKE